MRDCESERAGKGGPNLRELVMNSPKDRHLAEGEEDTGSNREVMASVEKGEIRIDLNG